MEGNSVFFIFRGLGCVTFCDSNGFHNTDAVRHFAVLFGRSVGLLPAQRRHCADTHQCPPTRPPPRLHFILQSMNDQCHRYVLYKL